MTMQRLDCSHRREPLNRRGAADQIWTSAVLVLLLACCCGSLGHPAVDEAGFDDGTAVRVEYVPVQLLRRVDLARTSLPRRPVTLMKEMTLTPRDKASPLEEHGNAGLSQGVAAPRERRVAVESVSRDSELAVFVPAQISRSRSENVRTRPSLKCCWACGEVSAFCDAEEDLRGARHLSSTEERKKRTVLGMDFPDDMHCCSICGLSNVRCSSDSG